jgi:hypothetical protein
MATASPVADGEHFTAQVLQLPPLFNLTFQHAP